MSSIARNQLANIVFNSEQKLSFKRPQVMGVLNLHADSFAAVSRHSDPELALRHALKMVADGATIIDIGAEPTNPRVKPITNLQEELDLLVPILNLLRQETNIPISIDTSKPEVMFEVIKNGASMINDVRALRRPGALEMIAKLQVPVCLMHMTYPEGISNSLPPKDANKNILTVIKEFFQERIDACIQAGISREKIILDPGIGHGNFGKNLTENLLLLRELPKFAAFNLPILVGLSRKTFIGELLKMPAEERLIPSVVSAVLAAERGAAIIRVHDVKETVQALQLLTAIQEEDGLNEH